MSSGRFDRKMCSISVEPMPSRMSLPTTSRQRTPTCSGSGSPAEMQRRSRSEPAPLPSPGWARRAAYKVGTPAKIVGRYCAIVASTASGVGRSGNSTDAAPTAIGNVIELPSP